MTDAAKQKSAATLRLGWHKGAVPFQTYKVLGLYVSIPFCKGGIKGLNSPPANRQFFGRLPVLALCFVRRVCLRFS